jgi:hypothetical protein
MLSVRNSKRASALECASGARTWKEAGGSRKTDRKPTTNREATVFKAAQAMHDADFVLVNGVVFVTEYLRVPDEDTVPDDVILEAKRGEDEIALTLDDIDSAEFLGDGVYRLKSGAMLRFLTSATVH